MENFPLGKSIINPVYIRESYFHSTRCTMQVREASELDWILAARVGRGQFSLYILTDRRPCMMEDITGVTMWQLFKINGEVQRRPEFGFRRL